MPSYQESKQIENTSNPYWVNLIENLRIVQKTWLNDEKKAQLEDHWDLGVIFYGSRSPVRIDLKTRSEKYFSYYQKDSKILIEIEGNVGNNLGSSVFNSNADLWACAWFVNNRLQCPFVFHRKPFAEWLEKYGVENFDFPPNAKTGNHHETKNILVDDKFFKPFLDVDLSFGVKF